MSKAPTHAVFYWCDRHEFLGLEQGVYLFESEEAAERWQETVIRFQCPHEFPITASREEVISGFQDGLGMMDYFHCYPIHKVEAP